MCFILLEKNHLHVNNGIFNCYILVLYNSWQTKSFLFMPFQTIFSHTELPFLVYIVNLVIDRFACVDDFDIKYDV